MVLRLFLKLRLRAGKIPWIRRSIVSPFPTRPSVMKTEMRRDEADLVYNSMMCTLLQCTVSMDRLLDTVEMANGPLHVLL